MKSYWIQKSLGAVVSLWIAVFSAHAHAVEVRDTGYLTHHHLDMFWVSNDEILFAAWLGSEEDAFKGRRVYRLVTLNVETGEKTIGNELTNHLCYANGFVSYLLSMPDRRRFMQGMLGQEKVVDEPRYGDVDRMTCRKITDLPDLPAWAKGRDVRRLRPEHGYLDMGSSVAGQRLMNSEVRLVPPDSSDGVLLPFRRREVFGGEGAFAPGKYMEFKQAYFVRPDYFLKVSVHASGGYNTNPWPEHIPEYWWWLYPDGRTETVRMETGPWTGGLKAYEPTVTGIFIRSNGTNGAYVVHRGRTTPVARVSVNKFAVSPDGCRVAFQNTPRQVRRLARLKVVELCKDSSAASEQY